MLLRGIKIGKKKVVSTMQTSSTFTKKAENPKD